MAAPANLTATSTAEDERVLQLHYLVVRELRLAREDAAIHARWGFDLSARGIFGLTLREIEAVASYYSAPVRHLVSDGRPFTTATITDPTGAECKLFGAAE